MSHTVKVNQHICGKTTLVTATLLDDANTLKIEIESDCAHVQEYADKLNEITVGDVVEFAGSKVEDPDIRASLSVSCMVPNAIFNASWLELGLLSPNLTNRAVSNDIRFVWDGHQQE